ncbi:MAG: hypothetical protein AAGF10_04395 [Verrucomicrobiota bacterium]
MDCSSQGGTGSTTGTQQGKSLVVGVAGGAMMGAGIGTTIGRGQ